MQQLAWLLALLLALDSADLGDLRWTVGRQLLLDPTVVCRKTKRLRGEQLTICRDKPVLVQAIEKGAVHGVNECQQQFQDRRWNCSNKAKSFRRVLSRDTPETGYLNAIMAAGITHEVARECSLGQDLHCPCSRIYKDLPAPNKDWKWGGCEDNVNFGRQCATDFLEPGLVKASDMKEMILIHNYEAGRLAVKNAMRKVCRCHGVSGSCAKQICWRRVATLPAIGSRLKDKHSSAIKMVVGNHGTELTPAGPTAKPPGPDDIIYFENSPSFCEPDKKAGSLGTHGRRCEPGTQGEGNCQTLCCGRGYDAELVAIEKPCKCLFHWCCEVDCETCVQMLNVSKCL